MHVTFLNVIQNIEKCYAERNKRTVNGEKEKQKFFFKKKKKKKRIQLITKVLCFNQNSSFAVKKTPKKLNTYFLFSQNQIYKKAAKSHCQKQRSRNPPPPKKKKKRRKREREKKSKVMNKLMDSFLNIFVDNVLR